MKRRDFITKAGIGTAAVAGAALAAPAVAQERKVLTCVSSWPCLLYTSPSPRDRQKSRMPACA